MLHDFLRRNHEAIVAGARARMIRRGAPRVTEAELEQGAPMFLRQLGEILEGEQQTAARALPREIGDPDSPMGLTASRHGQELRAAGFTISQVVQGYGDICQAISGYALELGAAITVDEYSTLNRCFDDAIAEAVTEFTRQRELTLARANTERLGIFAHELRNQLANAVLAVEVLKTGTVGIASSTGAMLDRSLANLRDLIDRSLTEVRLETGEQRRDVIALEDLLEEVELTGTLEARRRNRELIVSRVGRGVMLRVDRHLLVAAINNLVQNAVKFTPPGRRVLLRADTEPLMDRVLIEIEDECGGLPPGFAIEQIQPFHQRSSDRTGLGLGLVIARSAIEANAGVLRVRDLPGKGCVFTVDLPRASVN